MNATNSALSECKSSVSFPCKLLLYIDSIIGHNKTSWYNSLDLHHFVLGVVFAGISDLHICTYERVTFSSHLSTCVSSKENKQTKPKTEKKEANQISQSCTYCLWCAIPFINNVLHLVWAYANKFPKLIIMCESLRMDDLEESGIMKNPYGWTVQESQKYHALP